MVFSPFSPGPCQRFQGLLGQLELRREVPMGFVTLGVGQKSQGFLAFNWPILEYSVFHTPIVRVNTEIGDRLIPIINTYIKQRVPSA